MDETPTTEALLTFYCARADQEAVSEAVREFCRGPVHLRPEQVLGHDFGDAGTAEQVIGELARIAIDVAVARDKADEVIAAVAHCRRKLPVRWHMTPLIARGRLA